MKLPREDDDSKNARDDKRDRVLLSSITQQRDVQAMELFYQRFQQRLLPFLSRLTNDEDVLQETYNDVMYKVWHKGHQYQGQSRVSTWVFSIGYRACIRNAKKMQRMQRGLVSRSDDPDIVGYGVEDVGSKGPAERAEQQHALRKALAKLSPRQRLVIELAYFQGMTMLEISAVIGRPVNTVKTRLHHARKQLRNSLGDYDAI